MDARLDMNGYRDPEARAEAHRQALLAAEMRAAFGWEELDPFGGGAAGEGERECGFRKEGGVYAEVPSSPYGRPIEDFLKCNPIPIDREEYGLGKGLGVRLIGVPDTCLACKGTGKLKEMNMREEEAQEVYPLVDCPPCGGTGKELVYHVFDIVGSENYPNVADFIEEARRLGVSRRLELSGAKDEACSTCSGSGRVTRLTTVETLKNCPDCKGEGTLAGANQYAKITPRSRLFLLHNRAIINSPDRYYAQMKDLELARMSRAGCPSGQPEHIVEEGSNVRGFWTVPHAPTGCSALWWHDLDNGEAIPERTPELKTCKTCGGEHYLKHGSGHPFAGTIYGECKDCDRSGKAVEDETDNPPGRFVEVSLASGKYRGYARPQDVKPDYSLGVFAIFPVFRIVLVDPEGAHENRAGDIEQAQVETDVVDC